MKIANIDRENLTKLLNDLKNFNEVFRKDVPYDNTKIHKKPAFHPLFRRHIFRKTTGGGRQVSKFMFKLPIITLLSFKFLILMPH